MSNKPREWPNHQKEARDQAAEEAVTIIRMLKPLVMGERSFSETESLRRIATALICSQKIARLMEGAGAPTSPIDM